MRPLTWVLLFAVLTFTVALAAAACASDPAPPPTQMTGPSEAVPTHPPVATESDTTSLIPKITPVVQNLPATRPRDTEPTLPAQIQVQSVATPEPAATPPPSDTPTSVRASEEVTADTAAARSGPSHVFTSEDSPKGSGAEHPPLPPGTMPERDNSPVQAGEIDDNETWQDYLDYVSGYQGPEVRRTPLKERYVITLTSRSGLPVPGALVTISTDDETQPSLTHTVMADGRTVYHPEDPGTEGNLVFTAAPNLPGIYGHAPMTLMLPRSAAGTNLSLTLPDDTLPTGPLELDVLFLLDATGSMADEIYRIKTTLVSIGQQIADLPQQPDLRVATVAYRDRGDDFVTRIYDFDGDIPGFLETVRGLHADGGGDYPESLNQGLHEALTDTSWRPHSIKLLFLLADAPPHLDYPQDQDYAREMARAQQEGVKIFTVASSGLDVQGEYIFRQLAQQTMGRFVFILYSTPPQGELTTPHEVGDDYSVENLDRLIVRLITEELASISEPTQ